jgi:predicted ribosomally synthesized six-cysteine peptide SCIFF
LLSIAKTYKIGKARNKNKGKEGFIMAKHIITVNKASLQETVHTGGCGECQTSCQSACKTSCTVGNQVCQK